MRQLIEDAVIVTGDGMTPPFEADLLIVDDKIEHVGAVPASAARDPDSVVAARGRVVAPGFVDTHSHGALGGTMIGEHGIPVACELSLRGGVTKRICGVDGLSPAPIRPDQRDEYAAQLSTMDGTIDGGWGWSTVAEFYAWHQGRSIVDLGMYLGHGAVRRTVMGNAARPATSEELESMCNVVRDEAPWTLGLSTGLVYNPAVYSDSAEITALIAAFNEIKPAALFPHLRSESDGIVQALDEVLEAAVAGGGGYCNEHSKIAGERNWQNYEALADRLADAADSIPTMENMYPYNAGSTTGDMIFPPDVRADDRGQFLARLGDPAVRRAAYERVRGDTTTWDNFVGFCGGLDGVGIAAVLPGTGDEFLGQRLGHVARSAGYTDLLGYDAFDAVCDFFVENRCEISIITYYGNDATVERFFMRPTMAICTDGLIPGPGQKPHPRSLGAFPRALRMSRELGISPVEIIYRLATLPCRFLGLADPSIREGGDASMVLLDWDAVTDRNDFANPLVSPDGIDAVWVHGRLVFDHGEFNVERPFPGRVLLPD